MLSKYNTGVLSAKGEMANVEIVRLGYMDARELGMAKSWVHWYCNGKLVYFRSGQLDP